MSSTAPIPSSLAPAASRFLTEVLEYALSRGHRTAAEYLAQFPPFALMTALEGQPDLRAELLSQLLGLKEKTALRTPSDDAGRMLANALQEGDCNPEAVLAALSPRDRTQHFDPRHVWAFLVQGEPWKVSRSKDAAGHKLAQAYLAHMLDRALEHGLLQHSEVLDGVTVGLLCEKLPRLELASAIQQALSVGRQNKAFTDRDLYAAVPSAVIVDHVPLQMVFEQVIVPMARAAGFVDAPASAGNSQVPERPRASRPEGLDDAAPTSPVVQ